MIKVVTSFSTLMRYAHALGRAKKGRDPVAIAKAQAEHDAYVEMVRRSDSMTLNATRGQLGI